jgi:hypothetical protein
MSNDMNDMLGKFTPEMLANLRGRYEKSGDTAGISRCDSFVAPHDGIQTTEAARSGKIFPHKVPVENTGRIMTRFTGDPMAWMSEFMAPAMVCTMDTASFTGENHPDNKLARSREQVVTLQPGERIQIVKG